MTTDSLARVVGRAAAAPSAGRVLIVSNRLPLTASGDSNGVRLEESGGGLATGLRPVHQRSRALWIGWSGIDESVALRTRRELARRLREAGTVPLALSREEVDGFYRRYANGVLWPVLHEQPAACDTRSWEVYRTVNERYADAVARHIGRADRVWVHDYHLMLVPRLVRERCPGARIGFFLHTPFPTPRAFAALPHARELLEGMLGADVVGVHTRDYVRHFIGTVHDLLPHAAGSDDVIVDDRRVSAFACPMGIDVASFAARAAEPDVDAVARRIRGREDQRLLLGVDRLDYTKGIPQRLRAYEQLLDVHRELRGRVRLIQIAVPSREDVSGYRETRICVEALVDRINARFGRTGWTPIEYVYGSVRPETLVALYRAADVMLVTPLRDGMNLVAKEYVASRVDGDGVLVLSAHAGAAAELRAALVVDPNDPVALAGAYESAITMSEAERRVRMRRLRLAVRTNDVFRWSTRFLESLGGPAAPSPARAGGRRERAMSTHLAVTAPRAHRAPPDTPCESSSLP